LHLYTAHCSVVVGSKVIARLAMQTCGGQSMMRYLPRERIDREAAAVALMLLCGRPAGREHMAARRCMNPQTGR
jgi:hypothetical protein